MRIFLVSMLALMTAIHPLPAVAGGRSALEVEVYDYVMEQIDY